MPFRAVNAMTEEVLRTVARVRSRGDSAHEIPACVPPHRRPENLCLEFVPLQPEQ